MCSDSSARVSGVRGGEADWSEMDTRFLVVAVGRGLGVGGAASCSVLNANIHRGWEGGEGVFGAVCVCVCGGGGGGGV